MDTSFRITVECVNNRALNKRAREIINSFAWTGLRGKIELENPDVEFVVLEDCELPFPKAFSGSHWLPASAKAR